ncbi:hypothetical protein G9A89_017765 [Geosiphon pyriformis]|nr:hypothetical protein G9A89_017765 [Geosiphon pyriformis]
MRSTTRITYTLTIFAFSLYLSVFLLLTVSVKTASAEGTNTTVVGDQTQCSQCWVKSRENIQECKTIPKTELTALANATDELLVDNSSKFPTLMPCLCALADKVDTIISACPSCIGDIGDGLKTEASIVAKQVCGSNNSNSDSSSEKTDKQIKDSSSSLSSSTAEDNSGDNSGSAQNAKATNASTSAAISFGPPWTVSIINLAIALLTGDIIMNHINSTWDDFSEKNMHENFNQVLLEIMGVVIWGLDGVILHLKAIINKKTQAIRLDFGSAFSLSLSLSLSRVFAKV